MKLTRTFTVLEGPEASCSRATAYFQGLGYKQTRSEPYLVFERGSRLGSLTGFSPKKWQAKVSVQVTPTAEQGSEVVADWEVNTTGQYVTQKERDFWQKEADGLVASFGDHVKQIQPGLAAQDERSAMEERARVESRFRGGANWFFWIAGLSLINSIAVTMGANWVFLVGLATTQFIDGLASAIVESLETSAGTLARIVTLALNISVAGLFALFGLAARRKYRWAFVLGMVLYAFDALLFLIVKDYWSIGFHLFALFGLYQGLIALNRLKKLERPLESAAPTQKAS